MAPQGFPSFIASHPVLSRHEGDWGDLVLQHYRRPPGTVDIPVVRDNVLILYLGGPMLIEERSSDVKHERKWTDRGQISIVAAGQRLFRTLHSTSNSLFFHLGQGTVGDVAEEMFDRDPRSAVLQPGLGIPDEYCDRVGRILLAEAEAPSVGSRLFVQTLGRALIVHLLRSHSSLATRARPAPACASGARIRRVIDHMQASIADDLTLGQLARVSGLSQSQFARAFRNSTGQSPHRYLTEMRIQKACDLLSGTGQSIIEVGLNCGFEQPSHFATTFRRCKGLSPRAWRAARRN